ncbi:MAG: phosphatidylcholine/phosphatidylserine synthase [Terriglobales bacterium]
MNVRPMRRIEDFRRNKRVRKGMFVLPSLFTAANIAAGYFAISQIMQGIGGDYIRFDYAAIAIGFAVLFDGLDGRIARMTNTSSDFGKELDSLADVITFGVAPALLAFMWGAKFIEAPWGNTDLQSKLIKLSGVVTFLFLVACASRLARFNIQLDPQPSNPGRPGRKYFVGMPTPAGAGIVAAVVHLSGGVPIQQWWLSLIWSLLVFSVGYLMVCTWRFYSFKDLDFRKQHPFTNLMLLAGFVGLIWAFSGPVLFFIAITYMLSGVLARLSYVLRRTPTPATPPETSATTD